jgi:hypothetical protein
MLEKRAWKGGPMLESLADLFERFRPAALSSPGPVPSAAEVAHYRRLREAGRRLSRSIIETIPGRVFDGIGEAIGVSKQEVVEMDSEAMIDIFTDCCFYDWIEDGVNTVERYAADESPPADSDEREMLDAMTRARYSILELYEAVPGKGIRAKDLRTGEDRFVIDVNLSLSDRWSGWCLATRLLPVGRFWMTSGAAMPMAPGLSEALAPGGVLDALAEDEEEARGLLDDHGVILSLVRCALATGSEERIGYSEDLDPSSLDVPPAARMVSPQVIDLPPPRRPSRNAPCPCGSERLYKRCCGKKGRKRRSA